MTLLQTCDPRNFRTCSYVTVSAIPVRVRDSIHKLADFAKSKQFCKAWQQWRWQCCHVIVLATFGSRWKVWLTFLEKKRLVALSLKSAIHDVCKVELHSWVGVHGTMPPIKFGTVLFHRKQPGRRCLGTKDRFFIYEIKSNECFTVLFKLLYLWTFTWLDWLLESGGFETFVVNNPLTS